MTVRLSIAIQYSPARADLVADLLRDLAHPEVVELATDPAPPPEDAPPASPLRSPWRTYRHALETTPAWATHRLVLQDDVIACDGFVPAATAAVTARPDRVVSFYVGGNARLAAARVVHAAKQGHAWTDIRQYDWLPAVALSWPVGLLAPFLAWVDSKRWSPTFRADDQIIGMFLRRQGHVPAATVPSLIDHPDDVPSLISNRARGGRDRLRIAACWIGDCDATAIDWT